MWLLLLKTVFLRFTHVAVCSFLLLSNVWLHEYIMMYLSILMVIDFLIVYSFGPLWMRLRFRSGATVLDTLTRNGFYSPAHWSQVGLRLLQLVETSKRLNCVPQNSHVEVLIPSVTVFAGRTFREAITIKWGYKGGALIQQAWRVLTRKRGGTRSQSLSLPAQVQREGTGSTQQESGGILLWQPE